MSVDYDKLANDYAELRPNDYAIACELFERYGVQVISMCADEYTDPSLQAFMPFWYRKWEMAKFNVE